jgi:cell division transport system permease protein
MAKSLFKTSGGTISSLSTMIGITLVLVLVGVLLIVSLLGISVTNHYRGQVVVQVMLNDEASDGEIHQLKKQIEGSAYASSASYTSKADAAKLMQEELGEEFVDFLGYNPLPASIDIHLKSDFDQEEQLKVVISELEHNNLVREVVYQEDLLQQMNSNLSKWSLGLMIIGVLLLTIAVVLIVNTIQLAVFSQRFLIKSMQLVGATHWFIQKPFLRRGLWYGLVSSIFALAIIFGVLFYFKQELKDIIEILQDKNSLLFVIAGVITVGLTMSWIATAYAVNRFIRTEAAKLY